MRRLEEHHLGAIRSYTCTRRPLQLVNFQPFDLIYEALKSKKQIKKWRRAKKKALINGRFNLLKKLSKTSPSSWFGYTRSQVNRLTTGAQDDIWRYYQ